jgi:hypothetical protein
MCPRYEGNPRSAWPDGVITGTSATDSSTMLSASSSRSLSRATGIGGAEWSAAVATAGHGMYEPYGVTASVQANVS